MAWQLVDRRQEAAKREIRRQIGRLRRRIDRRVRATGREARRLTRWRTYVSRWPGPAVSTAFGIGLALAAGGRARGLLRWVARFVLGRGLHELGVHLRREAARVWTESTPPGPSPHEPGGLPLDPHASQETVDG